MHFTVLCPSTGSTPKKEMADGEEVRVEGDVENGEELRESQEKEKEKMMDSEWRNDELRRNDGCKVERMGVSSEKKENVRMLNEEIVRKMRDAEKVQMKVERKKIGEKGKKKEKRVEKQREEAERNRKNNRMRDWLVKRNLGEDSASYGNASYGNASHGNASGVCLGVQDVVQNVAEIVDSFALERLEGQQPAKVNDDWHTLDEETLVSRDKEVLADKDKLKDKDKR